MKVLIIGNSGCGKSTLAKYLSTGTLPQWPDASISTLQCECLRLYQHGDIQVIDTPGLEVEDSQWWDEIREHQTCDYVIVMINGTNCRPQNFGRIFYLLKHLNVPCSNVKVYAVHCWVLSDPNMPYELLEGPMTANLNEKGKPKTCLGLITYEDVMIRLIQHHSNANNSVPIILFSPFDLVEKFQALQAEVRRLKTRVEELTPLETKVIELETSLSSEREHSDKMKEEKKELQTEKNILNGRIKYRLDELVSWCFDTLEGGNLEDTAPHRAFHLVAWLPFAGNVVLEQYKIKLQQIRNILLMQMEDSRFERVILPEEEKAELGWQRDLRKAGNRSYLQNQVLKDKDAKSN